jgi:hypothetical protein
MLRDPNSWLVTASVAILLVACGSTPHRTFSDADLLVSPSVVPSDWSLDQVYESVHDSEGQESGAAIGFLAESPPYIARALETVYRYSSTGKAVGYYERFERAYFNDASIYRTSPWEVPPGFVFSSASAHQWRFGCAGSNFSIGPESGRRSVICNYLAQYDEFLVLFTVTMEIDDHSFMTLTELTTVIEAIDQKVVEHLDQQGEAAK